MSNCLDSQLLFIIFMKRLLFKIPLKKKKRQTPLLLVILVIAIKWKNGKKCTQTIIGSTLYQENKVIRSGIWLCDRILYQDVFYSCPLVFCSYLTPCKIVLFLSKMKERSWFRCTYGCLQCLLRCPSWYPGRYGPIRDPGWQLECRLGWQSLLKCHETSTHRQLKYIYSRVRQITC